MKRRHLLLGLLAACTLHAQADDPGKDSLGEVTVRVYFGTDGDPAAAGERAREASPGEVRQLSSQEQLRFSHYRLLGRDTKPLFRSYENWAQPIEGSDEILCRFEVESRVSASAIRLDLELWLSRKKTLKSGVVLTAGKPLLVRGPEWRGGRLIIAVELAPAPDRDQ